MRGVEACLELCSWLSGRLEDWLGMHSAKLPPPVLRCLEDRLAMAVTLLHQVRNRLLQGRRVPSPEKTCSVFEPHARWIGKGKAGCPQEWGVPVAILEDQHPFIPGHRVLWKDSDVEAAVALVQECQERCRGLRQVETAFRACKSELQFRTLFHWTESRIHTHTSPSRS